MNYYKELFYHCFKVMFDYFDRPYCEKWDNLLREILDNCDDISYQKNRYSGDKVLTIDFKYKGKKYTVWVGNGFYAAGKLFLLDNKDVKAAFQKRPSFKNQFRLLKMLEKYALDEANKEKSKFEQELYGE